MVGMFLYLVAVPLFDLRSWCKTPLGNTDTIIHEPGGIDQSIDHQGSQSSDANHFNLEVELSLPSKEGLNVNSIISILYQINKEHAPDVIKNVGSDYEDV